MRARVQVSLQTGRLRYGLTRRSLTSRAGPVQAEAKSSREVHFRHYKTYVREDKSSSALPDLYTKRDRPDCPSEHITNVQTDLLI